MTTPNDDQLIPVGSKTYLPFYNEVCTVTGHSSTPCSNPIQVTGPDGRVFHFTPEGKLHPDDTKPVMSSSLWLNIRHPWSKDSLYRRSNPAQDLDMTGATPQEQRYALCDEDGD